MATGQTILQTAMEDLGVLATGATASTTELAYGLTKINNLIGSWAYEELFIPYRVNESFSVANALSSRTIGAAGNLATARPLMIESLWFRDAVNTDHQVELIDAIDYGKLPGKGVTLSRPEKAYYEPVLSTDITLGTLYFDSTTIATETLHIISLKELAELAAITTTVSLPTPWIRALTANLVLEIAGKFGKSVNDSHVLIANESKSNIATLVKKYRKTPQEVIDDAVSSQLRAQ